MRKIAVAGRDLIAFPGDPACAALEIKRIHRGHHEIKSIITKGGIVKDRQKRRAIGRKDRDIGIVQNGFDIGAGDACGFGIINARAVGMMAIHRKRSRDLPVAARHLVIFAVNKTVCHIECFTGTREIKNAFPAPVQITNTFCTNILKKAIADGDTVDGGRFVSHLDLLHIVKKSFPFDRIPIGRPGNFSIRGADLIRFAFEAARNSLHTVRLAKIRRPSLGQGHRLILPRRVTSQVS